MSELLLEGWVSVRAALVSGSRDIYEILLEKDRQSNRFDTLLKRAAEENVTVKRVAASELERMVEGKSHGGVVARVSERKFLALNDLSDGPQAAFLVMLDGVEDPHNFGQAVRAAYACGAHGLIVRPRNWTTAAATVARASAGTSEFMRMAVAESDEALLGMLTKKRIKLLCTDLSDEAITPAQANLTVPLLLVVGGEMRGISKSLLRAADSILQIPYGRTFKQSLGVTSSMAMLAYEVMEQRQPSNRAVKAAKSLVKPGSAKATSQEKTVTPKSHRKFSVKKKT